jgi:hypothetical protein
MLTRSSKLELLIEIMDYPCRSGSRRNNGIRPGLAAQPRELTNFAVNKDRAERLIKLGTCFSPGLQFSLAPLRGRGGRVRGRLRLRHQPQAALFTPRPRSGARGGRDETLMSSRHIDDILNRLEAAERQFPAASSWPRLSPAGRCMRIAGVVCGIRVRPRDFIGWESSVPCHTEADLVRPARLAEPWLLELFPSSARPVPPRGRQLGARCRPIAAMDASAFRAGDGRTGAGRPGVRDG